MQSGSFDDEEIPYLLVELWEESKMEIVRSSLNYYPSM